MTVFLAAWEFFRILTDSRRLRSLARLPANFSTAKHLQTRLQAKLVDNGKRSKKNCKIKDRAGNSYDAGAGLEHLSQDHARICKIMGGEYCTLPGPGVGAKKMKINFAKILLYYSVNGKNILGDCFEDRFI